MAYLFTDGKFQAFDSAGDPLASGKVYTYAAGTTTPLASYTTQAGNVANANPVILDAAGRANIWLGASAYRIILKTSADVTVWDTDNIVTNSGIEVDVENYASPHFGFGTTAPPTNIGLFRGDDGDLLDGLGAILQVQRYVTADTGLTNSKALKVSYTQETAVNTADHQWAISGDCTMINSGTGNMVSVSGVTTRNVSGTGTAFGGHFQSKDSIAYAAPTDVQNAVGAEMNIACKGLDHPTANGNMGNRIVLHLIAHGVNPYGVSGQGAEIGRGLAIETEGETNGAFFRTGIDVSESSANANAVANGIRIQTTGARGLYILGAHTTADILLSGNSEYGLICNGTYTSAAVRIADDQYIGLRSNNAIKMRYETASSEFEIVSSGSERFAVNMGVSPYISLNDVQVVGLRDTGWSAMTGAGDIATVYAVATVTLAQLAGRVKSIQDALTTHGLLGA